MPNGCQSTRPNWQLTRSAVVRPAVYKTAALPTELHRRETRCMVAHPGLDVLILALTCAVADAVRGRWQRPRRHRRTASTDWERFLAAVCAKYVPKFQAATLIASWACLRRGRAWYPATAATTLRSRTLPWAAVA